MKRAGEITMNITTSETNELQLIESQEMRNMHIEKVEVLNKVKSLVMLADNTHVTVEMVANYYEVPKGTIESTIFEHTLEIESDGYKVLKGAELKSFKGCIGNPSNLKFVSTLAIIPKRAILRIGMLLRDSEIAKAIRTHLLNINQLSTNEQNIISFRMMEQMNNKFIVNDINKINKHKMSLSGIYMIQNIINNKIYIGSSNNCYKRWSSHILDLRKNIHHSIHLQRAWNKYGKDNFVFEILEVVANADCLIENEQKYLDELKPYNRKVGYNICKCAMGGGFQWTEKQKSNRRQISFDQHDKIIAMYKSGMSITDIALKHEVPRKHIWRALVEKDVNTSDIIMINYDNSKYTIKEFANRYNLKVSTITKRMNKGASVEDLFKTKEQLLIDKSLMNYVVINNKEYTFKQLGVEYNLPDSTIRSRFYAGYVGLDLVKPIATNKVTEENLKDIIEYIKCGESLISIANKYNTSNATISRLLTKYKINFREYFNKYRNDKILELYNSGLGNTDIGNIVGLDNSTICVILKSLFDISTSSL